MVHRTVSSIAFMRTGNGHTKLRFEYTHSRELSKGKPIFTFYQWWFLSERKNQFTFCAQRAQHQLMQTHEIRIKRAQTTDMRNRKRENENSMVFEL